MKIIGYAYKFGDNINTDLIISGRYKFAIQDAKELAKHVMEDIDPNFYRSLKFGKSIIVAGDNFGCGSSREQATLALKGAGIVAVVACSFARIFYRNAFNIGLPLVECDTDRIDDGDRLEIDLEKGWLKDVTKDAEIKIKPLSPVMKTLLKDGGLIEHFKKRGKLLLAETESR
jgi:3-isopropylmalate/(R)-2-methylmalate dehydratase small subunit